jgi:hypothetical protein
MRASSNSAKRIGYDHRLLGASEGERLTKGPSLFRKTHTVQESLTESSLLYDKRPKQARLSSAASDYHLKLFGSEASF